MIDQYQAENILSHEDFVFFLQPHSQHNHSSFQGGQKRDGEPIIMMQDAVDHASRKTPHKHSESQENHWGETTVKIINKVSEALLVVVVAQEVEATGRQKHEEEDNNSASYKCLIDKLERKCDHGLPEEDVSEERGVTLHHYLDHTGDNEKVSPQVDAYLLGSDTGKNSVENEDYDNSLGYQEHLTGK